MKMSQEGKHGTHDQDWDKKTAYSWWESQVPDEAR